MYKDKVRDNIIEINKKSGSLKELLQMLAREALVYYCSFNLANSIEPVVLNKNKYVVLSTSEEIFNNTKEYLAVNSIKEIDSIKILKHILNMEVQGAIINLGDESQFILDTDMIKLLYKEVIAMELYMKGGAYVVEKNNNYLLVEVDQMKFLNISLESEDDSTSGRSFKNDGNIIFKTWKEILPYFVASKCTALVYSFNNKDMTFVKDPYLVWLYESPFQN